MRQFKTLFIETFVLCLIGAVIIAAIGLTGCAAEVGKDNSKDLQNENTGLKVQIANLQNELKRSKEMLDGVLNAQAARKP